MEFVADAIRESRVGKDGKEQLDAVLNPGSVVASTTYIQKIMKN